jgi:type III secretory pathway component EscR
MTSKKNKQKETFVSQSQQKSHEKKINTIDNQLKALNQEMSASRMKSTFLIGLFLMIMISALGTEFQGIRIEFN